MTREELIKRIALKMDEISSSDDVITPVGTGDNNPLYTQINNLLNESVNDVLMKAPVHRIQNQVVCLSGENFSINTIFGGNRERKVAVAALPEDFIRLVQISEETFQRPIVDLSMEGDDVDKSQHNRFLVAKSAKPVAVIGRSENGRTITCYSFDPSHTPSPSLLYIKRYDNERDTSKDTDLNEYMIDIVSWVCAGKVFSTRGDSNMAKICDENALALMI